MFVTMLRRQANCPARSHNDKLVFSLLDAMFAIIRKRSMPVGLRASDEDKEGGRRDVGNETWPCVAANDLDTDGAYPRDAADDAVAADDGAGAAIGTDDEEPSESEIGAGAEGVPSDEGVPDGGVPDGDAWGTPQLTPDEAQRMYEQHVGEDATQ